jgi:hypothetical protein
VSDVSGVNEQCQNPGSPKRTAKAIALRTFWEAVEQGWSELIQKQIENGTIKSRLVACGSSQTLRYVQNLPVPFLSEVVHRGCGLCVTGSWRPPF